MKKSRRQKRVIDIIITNVITLIFMFVFLLMVFCVYCSFTERIPNVFGYQMLRIVTGSMEPEYPTDSYVVVKSVDSDQLKVGEVISFYSRDESISGEVNTHRIKEIIKTGSGREFVTKGDANNIEDANHVQEGDIIGKVWLRATIIDWVGKMLHKQWIYFLVIIIPLAIMMIIEMKNVILVSIALKNEQDNKKDRKLSPQLQELVDKYGEDILEMVEDGKDCDKHKEAD